MEHCRVLVAKLGLGIKMAIITKFFAFLRGFVP